MAFFITLFSWYINMDFLTSRVGRKTDENVSKPLKQIFFYLSSGKGERLIFKRGCCFLFLV